jgi:Tfp pilus assembly protein PilF
MSWVISTRNEDFRRGVITMAALLLASVTLRPVAFAAEDDAPLLVGRGLSALEHEQLLEARQLFDEAVQKGPTLAAARYYRAVTMARLGDFHAAIIDLMVVKLLEPEWVEPDLELGIALVEAERPRDALPHLRRAATQDELRSSAEFFSGLAHWRLGETSQAKAEFERALGDDQLELAARYYLGRIAFEEDDWTKATEHFTAVEAASPSSTMGAEAGEFLALMRGRRPYTAYASLGLAYDSNAQLAPDDGSDRDVLGVSDEADGRVDIGAGGRYFVWRNSRTQLSLGYDFSQRLYFDLTSFDLQGHRPTVDISANFKPLQLGIVGRYDYYRLDNDDFLQEGTVLPWVRLHEGRLGWAELSYRFRRSDYFEDRFADALDADSHTAAVRQYVRLDRRLPIPWLGYAFERRDALDGDGDAFAYDANQVEAGLSWQRLPVLHAGLDVAYRFRHENYDGASGGRDDDEHGVAALLAERLHEHVVVRLGYIGIFNDSNVGTFSYERHVASIQMEVSL